MLLGYCTAEGTKPALVVNVNITTNLSRSVRSREAGRASSRRGFPCLINIVWQQTRNEALLATCDIAISFGNSRFHVCEKVEV